MDISWKAVDMISRIYREYYIENEEALVRNLLEEIGYDFDEEEDNVYDAFELIEEVIRNEATLVYGDDKVEVYEMDNVRFVYRIDSYGEKVGVACWKDYPTILGNEGSDK